MNIKDWLLACFWAVVLFPLIYVGIVLLLSLDVLLGY
jgi:hypothetical protein